MAESRRRRTAVGTFVSAAAVAAVSLAPAAAWGEEVDLGTYGGSLEVVVPGGAEVEVTAGDRSLLLAEVVEVHPRGRGLTVVNDLPMQAYLEGIAEVPFRWPEEALKAQVVAARTYAWRTYRSAGSRPYGICATVACQVFAGREPLREPDGERWVRAVAETAGEVLLHDGRPILAMYSSTSGGHTRNSEDVFPSSGAYPYLRGVPDPEDEVSPLHTWQVRFTREEFEAVLSRGESLSAAVPVATVEFVPAGGGRPDRLRFTSASGRTATINASALRSFVSATAPELFPDRFPSVHTTGRRLPETLPSSRIRVELTDDEVIVNGRGYGHGVGMSQYGALGKAEAGMGYADILAAYYGGIRPTRDPRVPERVRVGLAEDVSAVQLRPAVPVALQVAGRTVTERALGTWSIERSGEGVRLLAPSGFGVPLVVAPPRIATARVTPLHRVRVDSAVSEAAEAWLTVHDAEGEEVSRRALGTVEPGNLSTEWSPADLGPGRYEVAVRAADEDATEVGDPVVVEVAEVRGSATEADSLLGSVPVQRTVPVAPAAGIIGAAAGALVSRRIEVT